MAYLDSAVYLSFALSIIALPFMVFGVLRAVKRAPAIRNPATQWLHMPKKSMLLFGGSIVIGMSLTQVICIYVRNEAHRFLMSLPSAYTITVNGRTVRNDRSLLAALESTHWVMAHHSHPTSTIHITVEGNGRAMSFNLRRDSSNPQEYWVFIPEYRASSMNEIGRITTDVLDSY